MSIAQCLDTNEKGKFHPCSRFKMVGVGRRKSTEHLKPELLNPKFKHNFLNKHELFVLSICF